MIKSLFPGKTTVSNLCTANYYLLAFTDTLLMYKHHK